MKMLRRIVDWFTRELPEDVMFTKRYQPEEALRDERNLEDQKGISTR